MASKCTLMIFLVIIVILAAVQGRGLLMLYRPRDITYDCANSNKLRYDISYGMGMSDTITLVFRTLPEMDYKCEVDVNTDGVQIVYVVVRYPNAIGYNCQLNFKAFHLMQKEQCLPICELLDDTNLFSQYWTIIKKGRFRFQYRSNNSVNNDMDAHMYQVTVTTARKRLKEQRRCFMLNETECYDYRYDEYYCMTNGIECDGIKNCGVDDWFDERRADCDVPVQRLEFAPIFAVIAALMCALLALSHILQRCLPQATSFFIFNNTGDNRLILDPLLRTGSKGPFSFGISENMQRKKSIIPVDWSDSSADSGEEDDHKSQNSNESEEDKPEPKRKPNSTMKMMSNIINKRLRSVVGLPRHVMNYAYTNDTDNASTTSQSTENQ